MGSATRFLLLLTPSPLLHHRCPSLVRLSRRHTGFPPSLSSLFHHHHHSLSPSPSPSSPSCPASSATAPGNKNARLLPVQCSSRKLHVQTSSLSHSPPPPRISHPWPEFNALLESISASGYFNRQDGDGDLVASPDLTEEFTRSANACLSFARDRPNLLGMLSRSDIEAVVENGTPFLFRNGEESARRMKSFLENNVLDTDKANMVDLMKFILSYANNLSISLEANNRYNHELVDSSARNLLSQLAKLSGSLQNHFPDRYGETRKPFGQNIEMKRGDWICPRCSFMNFARNVKCLECEEARPKRHLTGGEWECPQCSFFNYGRNTICLRCDCKRPGEISLDNTNPRLGLEQGHRDYTNKADIERTLAENEEKAQRWFSKVNQMDSNSDMSSIIADEDFPEIMPLRKGVNRFVVSTRKTPLERRLANAKYRRNLGNDGTPEGDNDNSTLGKRVSHTLDDILGRSPASTKSNNDNSNRTTSDQNPGTKNITPVSNSGQSRGNSGGTNSGDVPFVPLAADMFAKKPENAKIDEKSVASNMGEQSDVVYGAKSNKNLQPSEKPVNQETDDEERGQAGKSERWFERDAKLDDVTSDLASSVFDEDFPETMPMRKGENRFVVSKKKDRSLTSPMYKRRAAMEQAQNTNFVPFVPFPPDYFAKKDKQQPEDTDVTAEAPGATSTNENSTQKFNNPSATNNNGLDNTNSGKETSTLGGVLSEQAENKSDGYMGRATSDLGRSSYQTAENDNIRSSWSGKSLEGSAVKEPDPLDMSEEAKAERWFRRVAQIKDISELSQIPDEDFPSIMPMRKGVNRFVVSKRKTPLERRLTSQQYRRNLPIINSDPVKKENDNS